MPNVVFKIIHQTVCAFRDTLVIPLVCVHKSKHQSYRNVTNNRAILLPAVQTVNVEKSMDIPYAHAFKVSLERLHNADQNVQLAVNVQPHRRV